MPRIVLITNDSKHGQRVLDTVWRRGITLDAVLFLTGSFGVPAARGVGLGGRLARWPRAAAGVLKRRLHFHRKRKPGYAERCARVIATGAMNSRELIRDLRRLAPDWIILGGGGILKPEVIDTARAGVLNAHPALLPWIRGCGTTGASLENGVALGATLHRVDRGIDTGEVIERRLLAVDEDATNLAELELACWELAAGMMADAVEGIVRRGEVPRGVPQMERYPLFRWPSEEAMQRHLALAAAGRAWALYDLWRPLCVDPARGILPSHDFEAPPSLILEPVTSSSP
ncbi:MAG TPA: formyltransferase family protein [Longimicrobium sp.]|nr:formyltransferase family protein [Longimicrobium sp.]